MATLEEIQDPQVDNKSDTSDDEMPELTAAGGADRKESRTEKKSRKAIQKLGLKAIPDIDRVTVKQQKKPHFVISKPDVYKSSVSDTYIIFGEAKFDDFAQQAQMAAAESFKAPAPAAETAGAAAAPAAPAAAAPAAAEDDTDDGTDESGLEPKDIDLVMQQADVPRAKAVKALRKNKGDIVNTIMELSA